MKRFFFDPELKYYIYSALVKKIASILLLALLLFNWVGYRLMSMYYEKQVTAQLEARLDKNDYNEAELIEMRVPLDMPYQTSWQEFERYDGEIEIDGKHYQYVKRKIDNGELVLLCLPNHDKNELQQKRDAFFLLSNDLGYASKGNDGKLPLSVLKSPVSEYNQQLNDWTFAPLAPLAQDPYAFYNNFYHSPSVAVLVEPPESGC